MTWPAPTGNPGYSQESQDAEYKSRFTSWTVLVVWFWTPVLIATTPLGWRDGMLIMWWTFFTMFVTYAVGKRRWEKQYHRGS
jgi:hypothetical protein